MIDPGFSFFSLSLLFIFYRIHAFLFHFLSYLFVTLPFSIVAYGGNGRFYPDVVGELQHLPLG